MEESWWLRGGYPVGGGIRSHHGLEVVPTEVAGRPPVKPLRDDFQEADWHVPVRVAEPFQQEVPRRFHACPQ